MNTKDCLFECYKVMLQTYECDNTIKKILEYNGDDNFMIYLKSSVKYIMDLYGMLLDKEMKYGIYDSFAKYYSIILQYDHNSTIRTRVYIINYTTEIVRSMTNEIRSVLNI